MKNYLFLIVLLLLVIKNSKGQAPSFFLGPNLVTNPSFEYVDTCLLPGMTNSVYSKHAQYHYLKGWYSANLATPDWFDSCSGPTLFRVPNNYIGYQLPRTGNGYAGTMIQKDFREYLQTVLEKPLIKHRKYLVKYYINRGGDEFPTFRGCDRLGVHFAKDTFFEQISGKISLNPHLVTPDDLYFVDTLNWTEIVDTFISNGGEKIAIFGNFDKNTDLKFMGQNYLLVTDPLLYPSVYYNYDDVSIQEVIPLIISSKVDTLVFCNQHAILTAQQGAYVYYWDDESVNATRIVNDTGLYWVESFDAVNYTAYIDSFYVAAIYNYPNDIDRKLSDKTICKGDSVYFSAYYDFGHNPATYLWSNNSTDSAIYVSEAGTHFYTIQGYCVTYSDSAKIEYFKYPHFDNDLDTLLCNDNIAMIYTLPDGNFKWTNNGFTLNDKVLVIRDTGKYQLIALEPSCNVSDTITLNVSTQYCKDCIQPPNAFSPNNDGLNDTYRIFYYCQIQNYIIRIFNRFGQEVYSSTNPNATWDGNFNGVPCELGVYHYYIKAFYGHQADDFVEKKGQIHLLR